MPKTVECPVKRWPGSVTFRDPIPLADIVHFEAAIRDVQELEGVTEAQVEVRLVPALVSCVEAWELGGGFAPDPFPGTPRAASAQLVAWLIAEIIKIYRGDEESESPLA